MQEPATLHRYLYAGGNPVMNVDPSGEFFSLGSLSVSLGIMGTLDSIALPSYAGVMTKAADLGPRKLHPHERKIAYMIFYNSILYDKVRIQSAGLTTIFGYGTTINNTISFPKKDNYEENRFKPHYEAWFLHEMTHVWRYQNFGSDYIAECMGEHMTEWGDVYTIHYEPHKKFIDYDCEEQGAIVETYFLYRQPKYYPLIEEIRGYVP